MHYEYEQALEPVPIRQPDCEKNTKGRPVWLVLTIFLNAYKDLVSEPGCSKLLFVRSKMNQRPILFNQKRQVLHRFTQVCSGAVAFRLK